MLEKFIGRRPVDTTEAQIGVCLVNTCPGWDPSVREEEKRVLSNLIISGQFM